MNAFMVFQRFYQIHQHNSKTKTYDEFVKSSYYNAFVKFGRFIMHINPLYPEKYVDYVVTSGVRLKKADKCVKMKDNAKRQRLKQRKQRPTRKPL